MSFTLIMKNLRLILLACALVCGGLLLWQYIRTQVQAETSQADAQAATVAVATLAAGVVVADKAVRGASKARAEVKLREQQATQQAEKVKAAVLEQPVPLDMLEAINAS